MLPPAEAMPPERRLLERAVGRAISNDEFNKLKQFQSLVVTENRLQNLVSATTIDEFWARHILDSAQLLRFAPPHAANWLDVGSGAGLPGIVIACLSQSPLTLVEPRRLRADFLARAVAALDLPHVTVLQSKIEEVRGAFAVITARAVASLDRLFDFSTHLSTEKTRFILPKGQSAESELEEAERAWQGVFHVKQSLTDRNASILVCEKVRWRS